LDGQNGPLFASLSPYTSINLSEADSGFKNSSNSVFRDQGAHEHAEQWAEIEGLRAAAARLHAEAKEKTAAAKAQELRLVMPAFREATAGSVNQKKASGAGFAADTERPSDFVNTESTVAAEAQTHFSEPITPPRSDFVNEQCSASASEFTKPEQPTGLSASGINEVDPPPLTTLKETLVNT
jgi:hypothetical protein